MDDLDLLKKALAKIYELESRVSPSVNEPIAIISSAFSFPGNSRDDHSYWDLLYSAGEGLMDVPANRWDHKKFHHPDPKAFNKIYVDKLNFISENIRNFDPRLFGISPAEATQIDPQHRLLLKLSWEAIENASINPLSLKGSKTGVFIGIINSEYLNLIGDGESINPYSITGCNPHMASGRISHMFDLQGPSVSIDTACSSSLFALHSACSSLRTNECNLAIVGGVNLMVNVYANIALCQVGALSPDGRCKSFDSLGDGYGRGEGGGVLLLKRLKDAEKDNDQVLGVVRGVSVNHDGRTSGITVPSKRAQVNAIKDAVLAAELSIDDIDYIEAHGTGTQIGDPIELEAVQEVFKNRSSKLSPVLVGSCKANIGHLEAAAGVASIIKVLLCLKHREIPKQANLTSINPRVKLDPQKCEIAQSRKKMDKNKLLTMSVGGYGFSGSNANVIIQEYRNENAERPLTNVHKWSKFLLFISAHTRKSLSELVQKYVLFLSEQNDLDLSILQASSLMHRARLKESLIIVGKSVDELMIGLTEFLENQPSERYRLYINQQKTINLNSEEAGAFFDKLMAYFPKMKKNSSLTFFKKIGVKLEESKSSILVDNENPIFTLAQIYALGSDIEWSKFLGESKLWKKYNLPIFAFDEKEYWFNEGKAQKTPISKQVNFWLGNSLKTPLDLILHEFPIERDAVSELKDTHLIIHVGYIQGMLFSVLQAQGLGVKFSIEKANFIKALYVNMPQYRVVAIGKRTKDQLFITLKTKGKDGWIEHFKCKAIPVSDTSFPKALENLSYIVPVEGVLFYEMMEKRTISLGKSVKCIRSYQLSSDKTKIVAKVQYNNQKSLHPGIFDALAQLFHLFLDDDFTTKLMVRNWDKAVFFEHEAQGPFTCVVEKSRESSKQLKGSLWLYDSLNRLVYQVENQSMQKLVFDTPNSELSDGVRKGIDLARNKDEAVLAFLVQELSSIMKMSTSEISHSDRIYSLGFDSIMGIQLRANIKSHLGVEFDMELFLNDPSVEELASNILDKVAPSEIASPQLNWFRGEILDHDKPILFCFPYGGGGAFTYTAWEEKLRKAANVIPIQLPGREDRLGESPIKDLDELCEIIANLIIETGKEDYYLYGHSMGAYIAFATCSKMLKKKKFSRPLKLFLSGAASPGYSDNPWSDKAEEFIEFLARGGKSEGVPIDILEELNGYSDLEAIQSSVETLQADHSLVKQFYKKKYDPLDVEIEVFSGDQDSIATYEQVENWKNWTTSSFQHYVIPGNHFFIRKSQQQDEVIKIIAESLNREIIGKV